MAIHRSPNYPAISLETALELAQRIWNKEKRTPLSSQAAAVAMGYNSLSGTVRPKLSALKKYGILEKSGKHYRLSKLALDILHGTPEQKSAAVVEAINNDSLFSMLLRDFPDASPDTIRSELITRNNFSDDGANKCIKAFFASKSLVKTDQIVNNEGDEKAVIEAGSFVQWSPNGVFQFSEPKLVVGVSDDGEWAFVEDSQTGIPMSELTLEAEAQAPEIKIDPPQNPRYTPQPIDTSVREETSLDEGQVTLTWPSNLSAASVEDFEYWVNGLIKKAKRRAETFDSIAGD